MDRLSWPGWLVTYRGGFPLPKTVTHPSTNRVRRRVTSACYPEFLAALLIRHNEHLLCGRPQASQWKLFNRIYFCCVWRCVTVRGIRATPCVAVRGVVSAAVALAVTKEPWPSPFRRSISPTNQSRFWSSRGAKFSPSTTESVAGVSECYFGHLAHHENTVDAASAILTKWSWNWNTIQYNTMNISRAPWCLR